MYQQSVFKKIINIITWSLLFLLIPFVVLGVFAENSIPGQSLYTYKRAIEYIVLEFQAFDTNAKALYQLALIDRRFAETEKLLTDQTLEFNVSQINNLTSGIESTRNTINAVSSPKERIVLRAKLLENISEYRNQLATLEVQTANTSQPVVPEIRNREVTSMPQQNNPTPMPQQQKPATTITQLRNQLQVLESQVQQDQQTNVYIHDTQASPIPTPSPVPTQEMKTPTSTPDYPGNSNGRQNENKNNSWEKN